VYSKCLNSKGGNYTGIRNMESVLSGSNTSLNTFKVLKIFDKRIFRWHDDSARTFCGTHFDFPTVGISWLSMLVAGFVLFVWCKTCEHNLLQSQISLNSDSIFEGKSLQI